MAIQGDQDTATCDVPCFGAAVNLPANIDPASARLPAAYEAAKAALAGCERIDEAREWATKAEALASYARMADDETLRKLADRIQARAVRRAGELLKQFDGRGDHMKKDGAVLSQAEAGRNAGMGERQIKTAVRVANVPAERFEEAVESEAPPTVTKLAEIGRQRRQRAPAFPSHLANRRSGSSPSSPLATAIAAKDQFIKAANSLPKDQRHEIYAFVSLEAYKQGATPPKPKIRAQERMDEVVDEMDDDEFLQAIAGRFWTRLGEVLRKRVGEIEAARLVAGATMGPCEPAKMLAAPSRGPVN